MRRDRDLVDLSVDEVLKKDVFVSLVVDCPGESHQAALRTDLEIGHLLIALGEGYLVLSAC